jgi:hypothetical protein
MDAILIFVQSCSYLSSTPTTKCLLLSQAGLFSAVVTTFIIESYQDLKPDSNASTINLLTQISQQLSVMSNLTNAVGTLSLPPPMTPISFTPTKSATACNTLWFLSLAFSLACALTATLVEGWARYYVYATHSRPAPQDRARISSYLYRGVKKYKMTAVVQIIPFLLHISLFLFFAGLVLFILPVNAMIGYLMLGILMLCCLLYTLITALPIFHLDCPYWTPISSICWHVLKRLHLLRHRDINGNDTDIQCSMVEARAILSTEITAKRDIRDADAMCWTISGLREDCEFESFVQVIPGVVSGFDYSAKLLMHNLLHHHDIAIKLGYRIPRLLMTCTTGFLTPLVCEKRALTCLKAIWSLTMLSMPTDKAAFLDFRKQLRFDKDTLHLLNVIKKEIPTIRDYVSSALTVVSRSFMDNHIDRSRALEQKVLSMIETGHCQTPQRSVTVLSEGKPRKFSQEVLDRLKRTTETLGNYISEGRSMTIPLPYVMMEAITNCHFRLVSIVLSGSHQQDLNEEVLQSLGNFQILLSQAGFCLLLDYVAELLPSVGSLPHEAFNTLRRTFFRIDTTPVNHRSQELLVTYVEEVLGFSGSAELPQNIIDILLALTRVLDDPICIAKAKKVLDHYVILNSNEAAVNALAKLNESSPLHARDSPPLDLLRSHIYSDTKIGGDPTRSRFGPLPGANARVSALQA